MGISAAIWTASCTFLTFQISGRRASPHPRGQHIQEGATEYLHRESNEDKPSADFPLDDTQTHTHKNTLPAPLTLNVPIIKSPLPSTWDLFPGIPK